jgi:hypothetical protein
MNCQQFYITVVQDDGFCMDSIGPSRLQNDINLLGSYRLWLQDDGFEGYRPPD